MKVDPVNAGCSARVTKKRRCWGGLMGCSVAVSVVAVVGEAAYVYVSQNPEGAQKTTRGVTTTKKTEID